MLLDKRCPTKEDHSNIQTKINEFIMTLKLSNALNQRYLTRPAPSSNRHLEYVASDNREREEVIYKLKQRSAHLAPAQRISLEGAKFSVESGSSLEDALLPGRQLLQRMSEQDSFKRLLGKLRLSEHSDFEVTAEGEINAKHSGAIASFADAFKLSPI